MKTINSILLITLSNLGDIILTTPVLVKLNEHFPDARIDVITGEVGKDLFTSHPKVFNVFIHKRGQSFADRIKQLQEIRTRKYDMVVDLKNSLIPYLAGAKYYSRFRIFPDKKNVHKKEQHLSRLKSVGIKDAEDYNFFVPIMEADRKWIKQIVGAPYDNMVVINPGAKSHLKRWPVEKYAELADKIKNELNMRVLFVGSGDDAETIRNVKNKMSQSAENLCDKTSVGALAALMEKAKVVITNDSAPLHVASAVGAPTVAIFGPTNEHKYGPLSTNSKVLKAKVSCRPCENALCKVGPDEGCIGNISVDEVFEAVKGICG